MSSNIAIKVKNVSKTYQIFEKPQDRLKQSIFSRLGQLFNKATKQYFREFSALKCISFEVEKGETVGIIGLNGSGKSTLLQMICGTLNQTEGSIQVNGRVAALLELGAGFNPEFTGRENVYTNGALLGLSRKEIGKKFNAILAFADIGQFIDQPVKTYSSGMYVRLAFATAVNLDPDILIIDEALAVGDMVFQAKCMARIKEIMSQGTTVLFVSHDASSVRNLCNKVLWLEGGNLMGFGDPEEMLGKYISRAHLFSNDVLIGALENGESIKNLNPNDKIYNDVAEYGTFSEGWRRYGSGKALIINATLLNSLGQSTKTLFFKEHFSLHVFIKCVEDFSEPVFGYSFRDLKGNQLLGSTTANYRNLNSPRMEAGKKYLVKIDGVNTMTQGTYTLNMGVERMHERNVHHEFIDVIENALVFQSSFGGKADDYFAAMVWQDVGYSFVEL